jgi:hypothetical protein
VLRGVVLGEALSQTDAGCDETQLVIPVKRNRTGGQISRRAETSQRVNRPALTPRLVQRPRRLHTARRAAPRLPGNDMLISRLTLISADPHHADLG